MQYSVKAMGKWSTTQGLPSTLRNEIARLPLHMKCLAANQTMPCCNVAHSMQLRSSAAQYQAVRLAQQAWAPACFNSALAEHTKRYMMKFGVATCRQNVETTGLL
jgi:hypothetical protein